MYDFFSFLGRLQVIFFPNLPTPPPLKSQMVRPLSGNNPHHV